MESSIAEFLERQLARELLPTVSIRNAVLFLHCKEKFLGHGIKKATMHSKGGKPGHTCAHGWSSHIYSYFLGLLAMIKCSVWSYQCDN